MAHFWLLYTRQATQTIYVRNPPTLFLGVVGVVMLLGGILGFAHREVNNIWQIMWKFKPNMIQMEVCDTCRFFPFLSDKFYLTEIWIFEILRRSRYAPSRTYVAKYMFVFNTWVPIAPIFCTKTPIASSKPHPRNDFTNLKNMWFFRPSWYTMVSSSRKREKK